MIEQLKILLQMQRVQDNKTFQGDPYPLEKMRIALFVKLGELMNELPSHFEFWKKNAVDNRERALVEYVDALHVQLSLLNYYGLKYPEWLLDYDRCLNTSNLSELLMSSVLYAHSELGLNQLFCLGRSIGFTWEEVYQSYMKKNETEYERQMGYNRKNLCS